MAHAATLLPAAAAAAAGCSAPGVNALEGGGPPRPDLIQHLQAGAGIPNQATVCVSAAAAAAAAAAPVWQHDTNAISGGTCHWLLSAAVQWLQRCNMVGFTFRSQTLSHLCQAGLLDFVCRKDRLALAAQLNQHHLGGATGAAML